jgi:hypothetical protein
MPSRSPTLDDIAKGFLGTEDPKKLHITRGQKANVERQRQLYEQEMMHEACEFGDLIIDYVGVHTTLTTAQRAFAVALGLFNLRRDYPESPQQFDELVDLGGADLKLPAVPVQALPPAAEWKFDEGQLEAAAQFAETLVKYVTMKKHQLGVTNSQGAYGLGRTFHTLRYGYPETEGGPAGFDYCARYAGVYFGNG